MITCRVCGAENLANTIFCEECGNNLLEQQDMIAVSSAESAAREGVSPAMIRITILSSGRTVDMPYGHDILLGRQDVSAGIVPDLDLTGDGGSEGGVSRRHALISFQKKRVLLQDLGSTNGTVLRYELLTPHLARPLRNGDEFTLGNITLRIEFR